MARLIQRNALLRQELVKSLNRSLVRFNVAVYTSAISGCLRYLQLRRMACADHRLCSWRMYHRPAAVALSSGWPLRCGWACSNVALDGRRVSWGIFFCHQCSRSRICGTFRAGGGAARLFRRCPLRPAFRAAIRLAGLAWRGTNRLLGHSLSTDRNFVWPPLSGNPYVRHHAVSRHSFHIWPAVTHDSKVSELPSNHTSSLVSHRRNSSVHAFRAARLGSAAFRRSRAANSVPQPAKRLKDMMKVSRYLGRDGRTSALAARASSAECSSIEACHGNEFAPLIPGLSTQITRRRL